MTALKDEADKVFSPENIYILQGILEMHKYLEVHPDTSRP